LAEENVLAPIASPVDVFLEVDEYSDAQWCYVDIDVSAFLGKTEKATVTLPKLLITKIDKEVAAGKAKSRSSFLAESALQVLAQR